MIYAEDRQFQHQVCDTRITLVGLFICCMICHGELARRRPVTALFDLFYLMVSLGGAIGRHLRRAHCAARCFVIYWELPLGLVACGVLAMIAVWSLRTAQAGSLADARRAS